MDKQDKDIVCVNCPHCIVAKDFERLFCDVHNTKIPLEWPADDIENKFCPIRTISRKNQNSPHCQRGEYVELNDGSKFVIELVYGYSFELKEYHYSGTLYVGNHTFSGGYIEFKHSDIKRVLTREELFAN